MKKFRGFPDKTHFTPLPGAFFQDLLPEISDLGELKLTIFLLSTLYLRRAIPVM
jgi:hypothetical protein